jgi:hypothetical protein
MSERVPAQNKTSTTPPQATQASSPLLHQDPFTSGLSESLGDNSNISKELGGIQPKTIRRSLNWQNISVEAPSRSAGRSLPGGIQLQQEEPSAVSGDQVSADSAQKSALESSNSTILTDESAQKPLIARAPFNGRNIPVEAPPRSSASNTYPGGIQRLETSGVKEQEELKQEQAKELVQTKLTVGAPGDKYEQEADSMAAKVMTMPDSVLQQPIQRQTDEGMEAVQMQPLINPITPVVQCSSGEGEEIKKARGEKKNPYDHLDEHALVKMTDAERAKVFEEEAKQGIYRGTKVRNKDKSLDFELDRVNTKETLIIEDKIAKGFEKASSPKQAIQKWAQKQVYNKTKNKIEFIKDKAEHIYHDPESKSSSPFMPTIEQVRNIKSFEFRLQAQQSSLSSELMEVLRTEIDIAIEDLKGEFPDWKFDVVFGD